VTTMTPSIADIPEMQGLSLGDPAFWQLPTEQREVALEALRREAPVSFHYEKFEIPGPGFWAVTRMEDLREVSKNPETFSSSSGILIVDTYAGNPEMEKRSRTLIAMDDPEHARVRATLARAFTPKVIAGMEAAVTNVVNDIIDKVEGKTEIDIVADLAAPVPTRIICELVGIEPEHQDYIYKLTNLIIAGDDPEIGGGLEDRIAGQVAMRTFGEELAERKLNNPGDDIISRLIVASEDGSKLGKDEVGPFFMLLAAAGNETTRNAIAHGIKAFSDHPEQRELWMSDFEGYAPSAVEEVLRWSTPANAMRRTATRDVVLNGAQIRKGDKVVMFYNSANRDNEVFGEPYGFDITRKPNEHAAFGAGGAHFCLGAHLARLEIKVMFRELFRRLPTLKTVGEAELAQTSLINGMKRQRAIIG
jgi:methyl-branched lipid omega-hydroxylase